MILKDLVGTKQRMKFYNFHYCTSLDRIIYGGLRFEDCDRKMMLILFTLIATEQKKREKIEGTPLGTVSFKDITPYISLPIFSSHSKISILA